MYDTVKFLYGLNTAVIFDDKIDIRVKNVVMDATPITDPYEFRNFLRSGQWPITAYAEPEVYFTNQACTDESGCVCHEWREQEQICGYIAAAMREKDAGIGCVDAIEPPIGECSVTTFCG